MDVSSGMLTAIDIVLALAFTAAGLSKFISFGPKDVDLTRFGLPRVMQPAIGVLELGCVAALIAGVALDEDALRLAAGATLATLMVGAVAMHLRVRDPASETTPPFVLGLLAIAAVALAA